MNFTPIGRNVLLRLLPEPPKSTILITDMAPEGLTRRAEVLAVGERCQYLRGGETVVVRTTLGKTIGPDQVVIHETACLATV